MYPKEVEIFLLKFLEVNEKSSMENVHKVELDFSKEEKNSVVTGQF